VATSPMIILDDLSMWTMRSAPQRSARSFTKARSASTRRRIIVQRKIAGEFLEKFVARTKTCASGDSQDHRTIIGPLITPAAVKLVDDRVKEAVAKGATLHAGGTFEGQDFSTDDPQQRLARRGLSRTRKHSAQWVVVEVVDTAEKAVEAANRTMYGLTSSDSGWRHLQGLRAGAEDPGRHRQRQFAQP